MTLRTFISIVFLISIATLCSADVYVAQNTAGTDTGASCSTAHSAAWFNTSGNWGATTGKIGPGTIVHLCGTISSSLTAQGSGASGSPITILFESNAKLSQPACGTCLNINNRSYIIVDGGSNGIIENTNNSTSGSHSASTGISATSCQNCEIKNLTIQNIYVHTGTASEIDQTQVRCINFSGSNISVHNNTMHDAGWCLINWTNPGDRNVRIYNNNIYNIDHGLVWGGTGTTGTTGQTVGPVYFYNNHVHDYAVWGTSNNAYHHDGIHCYSTGSGSLQAGVHWADMWIYNNLFDGNTGGNLTSHIFLEAGVQTDGSQTPCMDASSKLHIFGNIFTITRPNEDPNGVVDLGVHSSSNPLVSLDYFNNTLLADDTSTSQGTVGLRIENGASSASANVKNNIFGGANFLFMLSANSGMDYNGYVNCISGNCFSGTSNFTTWKNSGADSHSINSITSMGGVTATGTLQSGSVMIGKGTNLSSVVGAWPSEQQTALFTDRNGNTRGSVWDIGALSTGSAATAPLPPTGLQAVPK